MKEQENGHLLLVALSTKESQMIDGGILQESLQYGGINWDRSLELSLTTFFLQPASTRCCKTYKNKEWIHTVL